LGFADGEEELVPGLVEGTGGVIVADGQGDGIEGPEGDAGLEAPGSDLSSS